MSSKLERYLTMANPFSTLLTRAIPALRKHAPGTESDSTWRLSNDPDRNFAYWNALGVASWAVPLAIVTTALVTAKAKRDVTKSEEKGGSGLLAASRPELSPRLVQNEKEKNIYCYGIGHSMVDYFEEKISLPFNAIITSSFCKQ